MSIRGGPDVNEQGLLLYLDASNPRSYPQTGTTWSDLSGNGNNGTLTNGPTFNGANNGIIIFDAVDDYILQNSFPTANINCISMWIRPNILINATSAYGGTLIQLRYGAGANTGWFIGIGAGATGLVNNEYITILDVTNDRRTCVADGGSLLQNTWCNIVFNFDVSSYGIFVDGTRRNTVASPAGDVQLLNNPNRLYIGANDGDGSSVRNFFNGSMAQVSVYNRSLTATEILQNFNATRSRFGL